jgi:SAM-dependent methyltransferase
MTTTIEKQAYDSALFEQLAEEYGEKPVSERTTRYTQEEKQEKAANQLKRISRQVGVRRKVVVELGCGFGWLSAAIAEAGAKEAIGVDIRTRKEWAEHDHPRLRLLATDISREDDLAPGSVDRVVSNSVFEHVDRPLEMLQALWDLLRPGGRCWLSFNLYRSVVASHRSHEIPFPWPHLVFDEPVCEAFLDARGLRRPKGRGYSWVNKLTLAEYVSACQEIGFRIDNLNRRVRPIDIDFYLRFEDKLGRYPALDLETDFARMILTKPGGLRRLPKRDPKLGYVARQLEFDAELAKAREARAAEPA